MGIVPALTYYVLKGEDVGLPCCFSMLQADCIPGKMGLARQETDRLALPRTEMRTLRCDV